MLISFSKSKMIQGVTEFRLAVSESPRESGEAMGVDEHEMVGLSIEPIWLEATLKTQLLAVSPPVPERPSKRRLVIGGLAALVIGISLAIGWANPGAEDWAARSWAAYEAGDYRQASAALSEARATDAEATELDTLERAIAVGPMLDEIASLIDAGQLARAEIFLTQALAQSPHDRRALAARQALRAAQAREVQLAPSRVVAAAVTPMAPAPSVKSDALEAGRSSAAAPKPVPAAGSRARARAVPKGSVRILSGQPALILVNGKLLRSEAPTTLRLPAGEHAIELRVPGTGRVLARRDVRVRAQRSEVLRLQAAPRSSASNLRAAGPRPAFSPSVAQ